MSKRKDKWVEEQRLGRIETKKRAQQALDNPVVYTHSITLIDKYYYHKIVLGLMIWALIALLGTTYPYQAAFVFAYAWKML